MKLKDHKIIQTEDGTSTLFSQIYNESAHSLHGATEETDLHYIQGCQLKARAKHISPLRILEIGFGSGLGFLRTLHALKDKKVVMTSYEIQPELIEYFMATHPQFAWQKLDENTFSLKENQFQLIIKLGDARKLIQAEPLTYHAIYQDAYSPRRNPYLWSVEWFTDLKKVCEKDVILSTYSASSSIRKSLLAAGFKIYAGEKFGLKRTSTRARLTGTSEPAIMAHLERSPVEALRDSMCEDYQKRE